MIIKLPDDIISRISAGEVITSPFNVVKECIENSIDANSTIISVDVSKDTLTIKISDNGDGIDISDFPLLCARNCTSKTNGDLLSIETFGFRGEALCSVSMVAKVVVESKRCMSSTGAVGLYQDGCLLHVKKKAMNNGTTFLISELFYNHESRKEYFYRRRDEVNKIYYLLAKYAIFYTNIKFVIYIDQNLKEDFNAQINGARSNEVFSLFAKKPFSLEWKRNIIQTVYKIDSELLFSQGTRFLALFSNINSSFRIFDFILFVNGRLVHSYTLRERIKKVYGYFLPKNRHPFVYLELHLNSQCVDVNIHPSKKEVIFDDEDMIFEEVLTSIKNGFSNKTTALISTQVDSVVGSEKASQLLYADPNSSSILDLLSDRSIIPEYNKIYRLKSLSVLKCEFGAQDDAFMKDMSYVGEFNDQTVVQDGFNLILFDISSILYDYFYQRLLFDVGNHKFQKVNLPHLKILTDRHKKFICEYFNCKMENNVTKELIIIDRVDISMCFPDFLAEFANYKMNNEKETFTFVFQKLASFFTDNFQKNEASFNLLKKKLLYKEKYDKSFKVLTSVQQLYKLFDRC